MTNLAHPPRPDAALYDRIAGVLGISSERQKCPVNGYGVLHMSQIACAVVQEYVQLPYATATVATNITQQQLWYLSERQSQLPGVSVEKIYQRTYPMNDTAAPVSVQSDGSARRRSRARVPRHQPERHGRSIRTRGVLQPLPPGNRRGHRVKVDALGNFDGYLSQQAPVPGDNLKTSLDANLQSAGQQGLQESINSNYPANGGAFVAMDPQNGQVYAMGSLPTYNANIFTAARFRSRPTSS